MGRRRGGEDSCPKTLRGPPVQDAECESEASAPYYSLGGSMRQTRDGVTTVDRQPGGRQHCVASRDF